MVVLAPPRLPRRWLLGTTVSHTVAGDSGKGWVTDPRGSQDSWSSPADQAEGLGIHDRLESGMGEVAGVNG